ncbi:hypothetical protein [Pseudobacteriovorax antillogorgiicola]|uniref:hypothetical protein n=1 Tax=Pseudobacteriovorax antillogorgiicola TaxID=1513793 RepID=UPI001404A75C|nr:hypothetical protein [Pseudobacteriovorax antillogorgiicola]
MKVQYIEIYIVEGKGLSQKRLSITELIIALITYWERFVAIAEISKILEFWSGGAVEDGI